MGEEEKSQHYNRHSISPPLSMKKQLVLQERIQSHSKRTKELVWKHWFGICISGTQGETPRKLGELRAGSKMTKNECSKKIKTNVLKVSQTGHSNWGK